MTNLLDLARTSVGLLSCVCAAKEAHVLATEFGDAICMLAAENFASNMASIFEISDADDCGAARIHSLEWGGEIATLPFHGTGIEVG